MAVALRWITTPDELDDCLLDDLVACWVRVSNAGGAVGFPFLPVDEGEVRAAAEEMRRALDERIRLLVASDADGLAGWLLMHRNTSPLTEHWATVSRVQTDLRSRGSGVGIALMREVERAARNDLGLEHLHIAVRSGLELEGFYAHLGWQVVGRWPRSLRLPDGEDRDEVLMALFLDAAN